MGKFKYFSCEGPNLSKEGPENDERWCCQTGYVSHFHLDISSLSKRLLLGCLMQQHIRNEIFFHHQFHEFFIT